MAQRAAAPCASASRWLWSPGGAASASTPGHTPGGQDRAQRSAQAPGTEGGSVGWLRVARRAAAPCAPASRWLWSPGGAAPASTPGHTPGGQDRAQRSAPAPGTEGAHPECGGTLCLPLGGCGPGGAAPVSTPGHTPGGAGQNTEECASTWPRRGSWASVRRHPGFLPLGGCGLQAVRLRLARPGTHREGRTEHRGVRRHLARVVARRGHAGWQRHRVAQRAAEDRPAP